MPRQASHHQARPCLGQNQYLARMHRCTTVGIHQRVDVATETVDAMKPRCNVPQRVARLDDVGGDRRRSRRRGGHGNWSYDR